MTERNSFKYFRQTAGMQSWRDRFSALRYVPRMLKLIWEAHHLLTVVVVALRLFRSFVPVAALWIGKLIIDAVVASRVVDVESTGLWDLIAIEMAIVVGRDQLV